jgi:UPF0755 protein
MRRKVRQFIGAAAAVAGVALLAGAGWAAWWLNRPMALSRPSVEVSVEPGTPVREVVRLWVQAGVDASPTLLYHWFRWSGQARKIRAGSYEVEAGATPRHLLDMMVRGDEKLEMLRLIEGWNLAQVRAELARAPTLKPRTAGLSDAELAAALGLPGTSVEGRLFPDTYAYSRGVSDLTVLKRAARAMQQRLDAAWALRPSDTPLTSPDQMLVLASIVEKETGAAADRGLVAGVLENRLRLGMPLQSDPTVIYGLGSRYDGSLHKADLLADTPYNSYTRRGLPPTPIAMPGLASLRAAARPAPTRALFFVARGDGSSAFSETLADHNRAVSQYLKGLRSAPSTDPSRGPGSANTAASAP